MLKNAHLRRQELKFEHQRTTQYASAQISSPSLHLGIFEHPLFNLCYNMLRWTPQKILNVLFSTPPVFFVVRLVYSHFLRPGLLTLMNAHLRRHQDGPSFLASGHF